MIRRMRTDTILLATFLLAALQAYGQGTPSVLRCAFNGALDVHSRAEPSSPIVVRVKCGDRLVLLDEQDYGRPPHIRTQGGKDGFILGQNFGQWAIEPDTSPSTRTGDTA